MDWDARALRREIRETVGPAIAAAPIQRIHPVAEACRQMATVR